MNLSRSIYLRLQGAPIDAPLFRGIGKDAPDPPDYAAAARAQGTANLDAAIATGILNRPNEINPFGSRTWDQTGAQQVGDRSVPIYTGTTALTPTGQMLFDKDLSLKTGMMDLGANTLQQTQSTLGRPFDPAQNRDAIVDAMYRRQTRLLDPRVAQGRERLDVDLINRGFSVGDKGYSTAMGNFDREAEAQYGDARDRALTSGAQQAIQEALISRQQPLTELNALRTGAMPQQPQFQAYSGAGQVQAAPVFAGAQAQGNAAMQQYGIETGAMNNMMSGLFGIGAAYAGRP